MLLKIAWRNVWRSKTRSLIVIGSIVVGIWALIAGSGFMNGFMENYVSEAINYDVSNIQIHNKDFGQDKDIKFYIPNAKGKAEELRNWPEVKAVTTRVLVNGMIASSKKGSGVQIRGIDVENEKKVTQLNTLMKEGKYFEGIKRNPLVIGSKLAEDLKVKVHSKVVLTFTDGEEEMVSASFRVAGIIKASSVKLNSMYAFVSDDDIIKLLGIGKQYHEIAILTQPLVEENEVIAKYKKEYPNDLIQDWQEIAPEMAFMQDSYAQMLYVLMFVILLALIFGIINTMLMAVLERTKELGMLMAIGMNKSKVFLMIVIETIYLSLIAAPFGLLAGYWNVSYYAEKGVDLSAYSEGLEAFGYSQYLYPYLDSQVYFVVTVGVVLTALLGALYPAWKAVKLNPVEALHKL